MAQQDASLAAAGPERWTTEERKAFGWTLLGVVTGGLGLECLIKIYEVWAETFEKTPAARATATLALALSAFGLLIVFFFVFRAAVRQGRMVITASRAEIRDASDDRKYPALITALSTCGTEGQGAAREIASRLAHLPPRERLERFCRDPNLKDVSWQQAVRGINQHVRWSEAPVGFPEVRVLVSGRAEGAEGSIHQWKDFRHLLETLYTGVPDVMQRISKVGVDDFENYDEVVRMIEAQLNALGRHNPEVMIDATGGQKPLSIAVAIVTLRSPNQRFQYVTNRGEVKYYNAVPTGLELPRMG